MKKLVVSIAVFIGSVVSAQDNNIFSNSLYSTSPAIDTILERCNIHYMYILDRYLAQRIKTNKFIVNGVETRQYYLEKLDNFIKWDIGNHNIIPDTTLQGISVLDYLNANSYWEIFDYFKFQQEEGVDIRIMQVFEFDINNNPNISKIKILECKLTYPDGIKQCYEFKIYADHNGKWKKS